MKAAIFDVDNTITTRDTFFLFFKFIISKKPLHIFKAYRLPISLLLTRFFGADRILVKKDVIKLLKGYSEKEINKFGESFARLIVDKFTSSKAMQAIEQHKKNGFKIILISASPEIYIKPFSELLMVDHFLCTKCEFENNQTSILGKHCYGEEKCHRLSQLLSEEKLELDYKNSFFYSDHHSDIPLFKMVGNPIIVNATNKLKNFGLENGWPHFEWR